MGTQEGVHTILVRRISLLVLAVWLVTLFVLVNTLANSHTIVINRPQLDPDTGQYKNHFEESNSAPWYIVIPCVVVLVALPATWWMVFMFV